MAGWRWNETAQRYQDADTGRFISRAYAQSLAEQSIKSSFDVVGTLSQYVADGRLAMGDYQTMLWSEIRSEYIRQYLSGIGGKGVMTPADYGSIGGMLKEQKKYFDKFMAELPNLTEGQIRMRAQMYINSAHEAHERARSKAAKKAGADECSVVLSEAEHCNTCLDYASQGWQPIGPKGGFSPTGGGEYFPADGSTDCLTNDKCGLAYRNSVTGIEYEG